MLDTQNTIMKVWLVYQVRALITFRPLSRVVVVAETDEAWSFTNPSVTDAYLEQ